VTVDLFVEHLVPLSDVPSLLPPRPNGRRLHFSTIWRWATRGVRGGIRLATVRIGGATYTSREAIQRFADELADAPTPGRPNRPADASPRARSAAHRRAVDELTRAGI
jgi:hypothetical protein